MGQLEQNTASIVAINNWINDVVTQSKLPAELVEQLGITDSSEANVIQKGTDDAKKVTTALKRGYNGTYNATTNTPTLINGTGIGLDTYYVATAGTQDFGAGNVVMGIGDALIYLNGIWKNIGGVSASDVSVDGTNFDVISNGNVQTSLESIDDLLLNARSTGLRYGGDLSINGGDSTLVDIASAGGQILDNTDPQNPLFFSISYAGATGVTVTDTGSPLTYWYLDNTGTLNQSTVLPTRSQEKTRIYLGRTAWLSGEVIATASDVTPIQQVAGQVSDLMEFLGIIKAGLNPSNASTDLTVQISAGELFEHGANFWNDATDAHVVQFIAESPVTFQMATQNGGTETDVTILDVGNYDVGGTITAIGGAGSRASIFTVYKFPATGAIRIQYDNTFYNSLVTAEEALNTGLHQITTPPVYDRAIILGYIITTRTETDLTNASFTATNKFGELGGGVSGLTGTYLEVSNNLSDVANSITALANLDGVDKSTDQTITADKEYNRTDAQIDAAGNLSLVNKFYLNLVNKTTTALQINVKEFVMHINGSDVTFPTENITLPASQTHYIGFDLLDYSIHYLRRDYQDGMIWVGKVTTDGSGVTNIEQINPVLPKNKIPKLYEVLVNGMKQVKVALLGDSLIEDTAGTGTGWTNKLFDVAEIAFGYNVPSVATVTEDNYSSGGETSHYGLLWTAKSSTGNAATFINTALSYDAVLQQDIFAVNDLQVLKNSPIYTNQYDVVIVGFGANGGTYKWAYYEVIIKELRDRGIEVILCTQNFRADNATFLYDQGETVKAIAEEYGCAIADTWVFVQESQDNGETPLADTIHLSEEGKNAYANSFRTIINDIQLDGGNVHVSDFRSIKEQDQADLSRNFPNSSEFDCTPKSTTGTPIASSIDDYKNPAVQYGNKPAATSIIELEVGETANFAHAYASAVDIVIDNSSAFDMDITTQGGGTLLGTVSIPGGGNAAKVKEGVAIPNYSNITEQLVTNKGIQVECTSGTVKLYGVLWLVYKNRTIRYEEVTTNGTWAEEAWSSRNPNSLYTDTIDDFFSFTYFGSAVTMQLSNKNAAGIVDIYLNGEIVHPDLDLYTTGSNTKPIYITTSPDTHYDIGVSENIVTVHLKGVNGSVSAPSSGNRRLQILMIKELDRR